MNDPTQLPRWAREALQRAAMTPNTDRDPNARVKEIDATVTKLRARFPECFQPDPYPGDPDENYAAPAKKGDRRPGTLQGKKQ